MCHNLRSKNIPNYISFNWNIKRYTYLNNLMFPFIFTLLYRFIMKTCLLNRAKFFISLVYIKCKCKYMKIFVWSYQFACVINLLKSKYDDHCVSIDEIHGYKRGDKATFKWVFYCAWNLEIEYRSELTVNSFLKKTIKKNFSNQIILVCSVWCLNFLFIYTYSITVLKDFVHPLPIEFVSNYFF